jgi:hypothetical protein
MIVKLPPEWCSIYPVRFARPSVVNDTPEAWAKLEPDYVKFLRELREAVWCFGAERVDRDLHDIITGRQGRTPDKDLNTLDKLNALLVAEHDARKANGLVNKKGQVNLMKLAREFRKEHHLRVKVRSVRTRLTRALKDREQQVREKAEFDRKLRKPSLVGSGTKKII